VSIFILIICSLGVVSAADTNNIVSDANNNLLSNDNVSNLETISVADENQISSTENVISDSNSGSFSDLQNLINSNNNSITLDKNYKYNIATDSAYINGITISNENYKINGNNFTIDGCNSARIINYAGTGTLTLNNLNLVNGKTTLNGGAVYALNGGNIQISGSNLINNSANNGGAVYTTGDVNIITSQLINNTANTGSGIYAGTATINYNIIKGNSLTNKVIYVTNTDKSNVNFNWWGKNLPEINNLSNVNTDFFVIATMNSYDNVMVNTTTPIVVNLNSYIDTKTNKTFYLGLELPSDYVKFNTDNGNYSVKEGYLNDGSLTTIFLSNEIGIINITAKIDNQTVYFLLNITEIPKNTLLFGDDFEEYFGEGKNFTVKLTDILGNPIIGQHIGLNLTRLSDNASKIYWATTDNEGYAQLQINLAPGLYTAGAYYDNDKSGYIGSNTNNSMKVLKVGLTADDLNINFGEAANYTVTLATPNITVIGQHIAINLRVANSNLNKTYWSTTDVNGIAFLPINLASGNYIATASYGGSSITTNIVVSKGYSLSILNWGTGGDITKNSILYNYITSTTSRGGIVDEIINAEKQGTVLVKFGNGNGRTVFINAGIHGNELSSQAAAYQIAEYLSNMKEINGTIYMICDLIPYTAQLGVREYNGVDPNRQATISGSVANNLVKLALSLNIDAFADMHTTKPGGLPGNNVIMGAYSPNNESAVMANYISKISGYDTQIVTYAGEVYPTALQDNVNIAGIPAITGEVVVLHNTITRSSTQISYNFQIGFLMYNGFNVSLDSNPNF
jgi:predicted outer membrane repeat protein